MANTNLDYRLTLSKDGFSKGLKGAESDVKRLDSNMNKLGSTVKRIGVGIAAAFSVGAIVNFGKSVIESLKNYEYFSASLRTLMHGDRATAKALEGQLVSLAATTPFSLTDVQAGSKQLLAYGFKPGNVTKDLKMLGDMASGVGAPLTDIVYLYGTLKTQGRAFTRDIMQFTSRGIPIIGELAKQFGVTEDKIKDLVEGGKIGFPQIEKAFKSMTSEGGQFFKMMEEQSLTVGGRLSNLDDSWEQLKVNIGKSQSGIIASTVNWASSIISSLKEVTDQANRIDEAFTRFGAKKFNTIQNIGGTIASVLGISTDKTKTEMMERSLKNLYVDPSSRSTVDAQKNKKLLAQFASNYIATFLQDNEREKLGFSRQIGRVEYARTMALIKSAQEKIEGNINLLKDKGIKTVPTVDSTGSVNKDLGSSVQEYQGAKAMNVNITVNELGKIETLNVQEMSDVNQLHTDWRKHLLELLNDANQIANR